MKWKFSEKGERNREIEEPAQESAENFFFPSL
jgi:hypothetical protein